MGLGTDGVISATVLNDAYAKSMRKFVEERIKAGISAPGESPDVFNLIPEYNDPRRGRPSGRIEKILGANFARLFNDVRV